MIGHLGGVGGGALALLLLLMLLLPSRVQGSTETGGQRPVRAAGIGPWSWEGRGGQCDPCWTVKTLRLLPPLSSLSQEIPVEQQIKMTRHSSRGSLQGQRSLNASSTLSRLLHTEPLHTSLSPW